MQQLSTLTRHVILLSHPSHPFSLPYLLHALDHKAFVLLNNPDKQGGGLVQDLVGDIHCIIEATIGRSSSVMLEKPNTDGVPSYVLGDPDRLRGILLNLYTNAAKFTKRGSIALRVRVANKEYRPSPDQVIAQQQRGPYATAASSQQYAGAHLYTAEQEGQQGSNHSWGSISSASPSKKSAFATWEQQPMMASAFSQAPAAALDSAGTSTSETWEKSPGERAAIGARLLLHQGQQAQDAASALTQSHDITTPVRCEHLAGEGLLQRTAQVIDSAAEKLQADAGVGSVGASAKAQHGRKLHPCGPLETVREDTTDKRQAAGRHGAKVAGPPIIGSQEALPAQFRNFPQGVGQAARQHAAASAKISRSCSGRVSNNSVLDQQDDSSSCSGGSAPLDSKAPPPDASRPAESQEYQEDTARPDSADRSHITRPRPASQQGRSSGASCNAERTQSGSDITESDIPYRCSSGSFSDYPRPLRKSLSMPAEALHEAAEKAISAQQAALPSGQRRSLGGLTATSYNGMSSGKATVGKTVATTVQDLGGGWFNTVAHRKAPVLVETTHSDKTHHQEAAHGANQASAMKQPSAFHSAMSPAGDCYSTAPKPSTQFLKR